MSKNLYRILQKSGVFSIAELQSVLTQATDQSLEYVHLGSRQDILFPEGKNEINQDKSFQNIVTSYLSVDLFASTPWIRGTTFLYVLEEFDYQPKLKINITDPRQCIVPLFRGQLNYIASPYQDYWYLYIKLSNECRGYYPILVFSWDIAKISRCIEEHGGEVSTVQGLFEIVNEKLQTNGKVIDKDLHIPFRPFPYYEGIHQMNDGRFWIGLYWRNNRYNVAFLKALCNFCAEHQISRVCITSWKSIIIKYIKSESRLELERLLGRFGINIQHSSLELNWHVPVDSDEALALKTFLVKTFDQNDISTYGLTFGVSIAGNYQNYFTSIVIEECRSTHSEEGISTPALYNVRYSENFNPNTQNYILYKEGIDKVDLAPTLIGLTKLYFDQQLDTENTPPLSTKENETLEVSVYQCSQCYSVYDPCVGDQYREVEAGTTFEELPADYTCYVCDAPKEEFRPATITIE